MKLVALVGRRLRWNTKKSSYGIFEGTERRFDVDRKKEICSRRFGLLVKFVFLCNQKIETQRFVLSIRYRDRYGILHLFARCICCTVFASVALLKQFGTLNGNLHKLIELLVESSGFSRQETRVEWKFGAQAAFLRRHLDYL